MTAIVDKFWETVPLTEMSSAQWEALCDGCGKCCLHKIIDSEYDDEYEGALREGETLLFTNVSCRYLDPKTCGCGVYQQRLVHVPDCVVLKPTDLHNIYFMPQSCSYRLLYEGKPLPSWHPLLHKGKKSKMHQAGMSVRHKFVNELEVNEEQFEDHIANWVDTYTP